MIEQTLPIQWSDQQWRRVLQTVQDEAGKARLGARFLPVTGPLPPEQTTIPAQRLKVGPKRLRIDEYETLSVVTLAVNVELTSAQAAQPELSSALTIFRKAANLIATAEDALIFGGHTKNEGLRLLAPETALAPHTAPAPHPAQGMVRVASGSGDQNSLLEAGDAMREQVLKDLQQRGATANQANVFSTPPTAPEDLIQMTSAATGLLGKRGHRGPYALILGNSLYDLAQTPNQGSLVLPSDRIKELLNGGELLRLEILGDKKAVLVSTGGDPIEIIVASDTGVRFLQLATNNAGDPRYLYRVSERVVLRIKDSSAVLAI